MIALLLLLLSVAAAAYGWFNRPKVNLVAWMLVAIWLLLLIPHLATYGPPFRP